MSKKSKIVPLSPLSPYRLGMRLMVLPVRAAGEQFVCRAVVTILESNGAWLEPLDKEQRFPPEEEVYLVEFRDRWVITHRSRILRREKSQVWVDCPSLSQREENPLSPYTGRKDFRVEANLAVMIMLRDEEFEKALPRSGVLSDLSRGGMGLSVPLHDIYATGQRVEVQVVSWAYPVSVETTVARVWIEGEVKRLALAFPDDMTVEQRELVSSFVIQVQRRDALQNSLPASLEED